ncbi:MAG: iron chelate uptake ABC transporter family permease subunit [Archaeoglobaceae archaeon]
MDSSLAILMISAIVSIAGNLAIFRGASFLIAGVAHSALAGIALTIFLASLGIELDYFLIATIFAVLFALIATTFSKFSDIDTGIGVSFALAMAVAVILISLARGYTAKLWSFLFGELFLITEKDFLYLSVALIVTILVFGVLYDKLLFFLFDPEGAEASGINVKLIDATIVAIIAVSVVAVIRAVGAILAYSIFVAPCAVAKRVSKSIAQSLAYSFLITLICLILGLIVSLTFPISASAISAFFASLLYLLIAMKRG